MGRPPSTFSLAHRSGLRRVKRQTKAEMDGVWRGETEWIRRRSTGKKKDAGRKERERLRQRMQPSRERCASKIGI